MKEDTPRASQREVETRRLGLQGRLTEKVADAKEDPAALDAARAGRFKATGEPETAGSIEDVAE